MAKTNIYALLRITKGWTKKELAGRMGVAQSTVMNTELVKGNPSRKILERYAKTFNVTIPEMTGFNPDNFPDYAGALLYAIRISSGLDAIIPVRCQDCMYSIQVKDSAFRKEYLEECLGDEDLVCTINRDGERFRYVGNDGYCDQGWCRDEKGTP